MELRRVKAKVTGTQAVNNLYLEAGNEYDIEEGHFSPDLFDPIDWEPTPPEPAKTKPSAMPGESSAVESAGDEKPAKKGRA